MTHLTAVDELPKENGFDFFKQGKKPYAAGDTMVFENALTGDQAESTLTRVVTYEKALRQDWRLVFYEIKTLPGSAQA